jgi:hypothetical protein
MDTSSALEHFTQSSTDLRKPGCCVPRSMSLQGKFGAYIEQLLPVEEL